MLEVKNAFLNKALEKRFFIFDDNIRFYKKARDQKLHNKIALSNYTAGYICFINTPSDLVNSNDNG